MFTVYFDTTSSILYISRGWTQLRKFWFDLKHSLLNIKGEGKCLIMVPFKSCKTWYTGEKCFNVNGKNMCSSYLRYLFHFNNKNFFHLDTICTHILVCVYTYIEKITSSSPSNHQFSQHFVNYDTLDIFPLPQALSETIFINNTFLFAP